VHPRPEGSRRALLLAAPALLAWPLEGRAQAVDAPNFVAATLTLATSGQPKERALRSLSALGFQAVVYLAPFNVSSAVAAEPDILSAQGIEFVHIPIPFAAPTAAHVQAVFAALRRLEGRKVLVHCEINLRASTLVFLYRAIERKENPDDAYQAMRRIWSPHGAWRPLVVQELARGNVAFELY
jgi:protein tyrosine phosphatase (PTP) superfamily phosphohydrolase (DUF442 family)